MAQGAFAFEDLQLLAALGLAGSLSGAARRLGVDHSTAFRRLGALERRLGVRLFERARDGYTPTPAGEAAIATAARVLDDLAGLERRLAGEDLRPSGVVRVTTTDTLVELLAPILNELRAAHPEIVVEVIVANAFLTLTKRDADVAIRPAARPSEPLVGRKVGSIAYAIYGARHRFAAATRARLDICDWVGFEESLAHLAAAQWMSANIPAERVVQRASSLLAMRAAVHAAAGLALLPCFLVDHEPDLVRIGPPIAELATPLWLLTHPDLRRVARVRAFLDFAAAALAARRRILEGKS